jgi:hypothetical protein
MSLGRRGTADIYRLRFPFVTSEKLCDASDIYTKSIERKRERKMV